VSPITVAAKMVAAGEADAMVSAGNTGAFVLAAAKNFKLIRGVKKAALASVPAPDRAPRARTCSGLLLDVGATIRCSAVQLTQFAVMGSNYARRISKVASPRVGLLNMGTEESKGGEVLVEAHRRIKSLPSINFIGNIEGNDVTSGKADVIITEGLLGNVVLKLIEGIGEVAATVATHAARTTALAHRHGDASTALAHARPGRTSAPTAARSILGFESLCIKAHGRSTAPAIRNAIKVAAKAVRDRISPENRGDAGADPVSEGRSSGGLQTAATSARRSPSAGISTRLSAHAVREPAPDGPRSSRSRRAA
jgi:glycerol-3-phosphate acyltransferase PlsX